jgi:hypothetical protein
MTPIQDVFAIFEKYASDADIYRGLRRKGQSNKPYRTSRLNAKSTAWFVPTAASLYDLEGVCIAEWVAQALWNSHHGSSKGVQQLPTRLIHRRRSEGRGNDFRVQNTTAPRQVKICEVCGAEGVKNRYCRSCAVDASREVMAQVALLGHAKPKCKKTKAHISKTLSDHAVANTWWNPSTLPKWLNEECYLQKIQPRLRRSRLGKYQTLCTSPTQR